MHATVSLSACSYQILAQARNTAIAPACAVGTRDDASTLWLSTLRAAIAFRLARSEAVCTSLLCYLATRTPAQLVAHHWTCLCCSDRALVTFARGRSLTVTYVPTTVK